MPWSRPTFAELLTEAAADIASAIPGADALLRFSDLNIIAKVLQANAQLHYGYQDWIALQCVPFTATGEFLEGWAALKNVFRKAATPASGPVIFSNGTTGVPIPTGTPIQRGDGIAFVVTAGATTDGSGNCNVTIACVTPGSVGNCISGTVMTLGIAIAGIQSSGQTTANFANGTDTELDDSLRSRMLEAFQDPPQGGAVADYVGWATAIPAVTRAWVRPNGNGAGTVIVYFMMDETEEAFGGFPQGTNGVAAAEPRDAPAAGDQLVVANVIFPLQPTTALVYAFAPTANPIAFTISGIVGGTLQAQVTAAIADAFTRLATPGGVYLPDSNVPAGQVDLSDIESAIAAIPGTEGFIISVPAGNITSGVGQLPTVGTVTYL